MELCKLVFMLQPTPNELKEKFRSGLKPYMLKKLELVPAKLVSTSNEEFIGNVEQVFCSQFPNVPPDCDPLSTDSDLETHIW